MSKLLQAACPRQGRRKWLWMGALRGPVALGVASYEYLIATEAGQFVPQGLLVHFSPAQESTVNSLLADYESAETQLWSWPKLKALSDDFMAQLRFVAITLNILLVTTLAVAVALIQYVFSLQRLHEFALMLAMGFTHSQLIGKLLMGLLLVMGAGWTAGTLLSVLTSHLLTTTVFFERGLVLGPLTAGIPWTIPTPVIVALVGTATVAWELRRLDPVGILERRD